MRGNVIMDREAFLEPYKAKIEALEQQVRELENEAVECKGYDCCPLGPENNQLIAKVRELESRICEAISIASVEPKDKAILIALEPPTKGDRRVFNIHDPVDNCYIPITIESAEPPTDKPKGEG